MTGPPAALLPTVLVVHSIHLVLDHAMPCTYADVNASSCNHSLSQGSRKTATRGSCAQQQGLHRPDVGPRPTVRSDSNVPYGLTHPSPHLPPPSPTAARPAPVNRRRSPSGTFVEPGRQGTRISQTWSLTRKGRAWEDMRGAAEFSPKHAVGPRGPLASRRSFLHPGPRGNLSPLSLPTPGLINDT